MVGFPLFRNCNGLSPRVRGNLSVPVQTNLERGSIPACAGEPGYTYIRSHYTTVYPRVCGGTAASLRQALRLGGLSPRVRGNPWDEALVALRARSIPACAGEPCSGKTSYGR